MGVEEYTAQEISQMNAIVAELQKNIAQEREKLIRTGTKVYCTIDIPF